MAMSIKWLAKFYAICCKMNPLSLTECPLPPLAYCCMSWKWWFTRGICPSCSGCGAKSYKVPQLDNTYCIRTPIWRKGMEIYSSQITMSLVLCQAQSKSWAGTTRKLKSGSCLAVLISSTPAWTWVFLRATVSLAII